MTAGQLILKRSLFSLQSGKPCQRSARSNVTLQTWVLVTSKGFAGQSAIQSCSTPVNASRNERVVVVVIIVIVILVVVVAVVVIVVVVVVVVVVIVVVVVVVVVIIIVLVGVAPQLCALLPR